FFTSRVYARWLLEGVQLLLDGADVATVDRAARDIGFPIGPLQAHDEASLGLVLDASLSQVADRVMTDRFDVNRVRDSLQALLSAGITGRRQGKGFYSYRDGRRSGPNPAVPDLIGETSGVVLPQIAGERLLLAFATEAFLCWD